MSAVTTVKRNVGTCPACRAFLWADIDLTATVTGPSWDTCLDKPSIYARVNIVAMRLEHACSKEDEPAITTEADR